jgi:hypothetical protein
VRLAIEIVKIGIILIDRVGSQNMKMLQGEICEFDVSLD